MATIKYTGARYITKFADPIQWSADRAYEQIVAVQNNGFTYLSKQPVPVGVDINNAEFWLLWADPNAQMEQLRQIVEQYIDDVEEVEAAIETIKSDVEAANAAIQNEAQAREEADNTLEQSIQAEAAARETADNELKELIDTAIMTYDNLNSAKEKVNEDNKYIKTLEYHANSGIGGALYKVSTEVPATYYEESASGLYLELINPKNVSQFGALGNGTADDTEALQNAINNMNVINFEPNKNYKTSNLLINSDNKILNGNGSTIFSESYQETTLSSALNIGGNEIQVSDGSFFHVNQTAYIYNTSTNKGYQIVITSVNGNTLGFASYKPFKLDDTSTDASPYNFPSGSSVYTGTGIFSIMKGLNVSSSGIVKNVIIKNFVFVQPTELVQKGLWGQLAYGVISYNAENISFIGNHVKSINALFLMFYGYHNNVLVENNMFENSTSSYAVCAHWDMQNISTNNRTHGFNVLNNTLTDCNYGIIYSSVDGGLCQGNRLNNDVYNRVGIYIYGGDISLFTSYDSYNQSDYYSKNVIVSDNVLNFEGRKSGFGIGFVGAKYCQASNNSIKDAVEGMRIYACEKIDITNNIMEYPYNAGSVENCSIRLWGAAKNLFIHDNMFNTERIMRIEAHHPYKTTNVEDTSKYWGYDDTTVYIDNNKVDQGTSTSLIWVDGTTENNPAPTILKDVPKRIIFNENTIVAETSTPVTVFQLNSALQNYITDVSNLTPGQMAIYNNISKGLVSIATKFRPYVPSEGNITLLS